LKEADSKLIAQLARLRSPNCLSERELGEFASDSLAAQERLTAEAHLRSCPYCINRVVEMREAALLLIEGEPVPDRLIARLQALVPDEPAAAAAPRAAVEGKPARIANWLLRVGETLAAWLTPRFAVEAIAVAAVAILLLMVMSPNRRRFQGGGGQSAIAPLSASLGGSETAFVTAFRQGVATVAVGAIVAALDQPPLLAAVNPTRGAGNVEAYERALSATVVIVTDRGIVGLGSMVAPSQVLTNWHLVEGVRGVAVMIPQRLRASEETSGSFVAEVTKFDATADLAVLTIVHPPPGLGVIPLGETAPTEPGAELWLIGSVDKRIALAPGTFTAMRPDFAWPEAKVTRRSAAIQALCESPPKSPGGAMIDAQGRLVGVYAYGQPGGGVYGVGLETIKEFLARPARESPAAASAATPSSYRAESFGPRITGVYLSSVEPPPDLWFVYDVAGGSPSYSASGRKNRLAIDTIVKPRGPDWNTLVYYFDSACAGQIDLIGYSERSGTIGRYERPAEKISLASLAPEISGALRAGIIPYPKLHLCGQPPTGQ
jgi:S1-C subfamily serine protease